jgi:hypothetical protein
VSGQIEIVEADNKRFISPAFAHVIKVFPVAASSIR